MKSINVGRYVIPLWLIAVLLISGIGVEVLAYNVWGLIVPRGLFGDNQDYSNLGEYTPIERRIIGVEAVCREPGIAESITALLVLDRGNNEPTEPFKIKCAIYREQAGSIVKYAETETRELWEEASPVPIWYTFNFRNPKPSLENRTYWVLALAELVPGFPYIYFDGAQGALAQDVKLFEFPDVLADPSFYNSSISIYCTYSLAGPLRTPFMIAFMIAFLIPLLLAVMVYLRRFGKPKGLSNTRTSFFWFPIRHAKYFHEMVDCCFEVIENPFLHFGFILNAVWRFASYLG